MSPHQFKELLTRYSNGECTEAEEKLIHDWYNNIGKNVPEKSQSDKTETSVPHKDVIESRIWAAIDPRQLTVESHSIVYYLWRAAACILVLALAGAAVYQFSSYDDFKNEVAAIENVEAIDNARFKTVVNTENQPQQIKLDDGSDITLKPGSEISVARNFTDNREVHLTGEAFFSVKRDSLRPFMVYTNEVVTKVLGTSFTIKAYKNEKQITIAVKTGKVSVYTNENADPVAQNKPASEVILTPNQQIVYNRESEKVLKQLVEEPEIILPEPTLFNMVYDGAPVTRIFDVLEENYGVEIDYDEEVLDGCVVTTNMSDEGFYERIEVICKAINAEYTITDAVIIITSRGCL